MSDVIIEDRKVKYTKIYNDFYIGKNLSLKKISLLLDIPKQTISSNFEKFNLKKRPHRKLKFDWYKIYEEYKKGESTHILSKKYLCQHQTIIKNFNKRNLKLRTQEETCVGSKNINWKGGNFSRNLLIKQKVVLTALYRDWRKKVFKRDKYCCRNCGKNKYVQAHHIITQAEIFMMFEFKSIEDCFNCDLFWDIDNGITLCLECHKYVHRGRR